MHQRILLNFESASSCALVNKAEESDLLDFSHMNFHLNNTSNQLMTNIRATSEEHGLFNCKKHLLSDVLGEMSITVGNVFNGIELIKEKTQVQEDFRGA